MPVVPTLLAGPSTSLRDLLVRCLVLRRPRLAAVVYEVAPQDGTVALTRTVVDAGGVQHREPLPLTGCCLSCTLLADAAPALELVEAAERWSEVVVALPAALRPGRVAEVLRGEGVRVDTVTTVVDARLLRAQLEGGDLLAERGLAVAATDRRSTAELVAGQLEDADVLAVADLHAVGSASAQTVQALLAHLAPLATQVVIGPGGSGCDDVVSTGRHDPSTSAADRERLATLAVGLCPPACGVTTVLWGSTRPLHPGRLGAVLPDLVSGVLRSRGRVWLANRPAHRVGWDGAGASLSFGDPLPWTAPPGTDLVLTGVGLDADRVRRQLESCVATDAEVAAGADLDDPFAAALGPADRPVDR